MVQGHRAAGVARRGHSQEIFRIPNQQDSTPLFVGGRKERRFKDDSRFPGATKGVGKNWKTAWGGRGAEGVRTERAEGLILRQVVFEEPKDNQDISTEQGFMARGEVRASHSNEEAKTIVSTAPQIVLREATPLFEKISLYLYMLLG